MQQYNSFHFDSNDILKVSLTPAGNIDIIITDPRDQMMRAKITTSKEGWRKLIRQIFREIYTPEEGLEDPLSL